MPITPFKQAHCIFKMYSQKLVRESQKPRRCDRLKSSPSTNCMTNFQICLYTYEPCLPKGSDCPAEGGGVGLSGGRGGKGVP